MKDLFLSYELSVEFKKLGFNENCFATYVNEMDFELQDFFQNYDTFPSHIIAAPLKTQVFDWVREKYNINAWVSCYQEEDDLHIDGTYSYFIYKDKQYIADQLDFETYKKAEIECIKQLIKLLK